jgi:hypothetical protein
MVAGKVVLILILPLSMLQTNSLGHFGLPFWMPMENTPSSRIMENSYPGAMAVLLVPLLTSPLFMSLIMPTHGLNGTWSTLTCLNLDLLLLRLITEDTWLSAKLVVELILILLSFKPALLLIQSGSWSESERRLPLGEVTLTFCPDAMAAGLEELTLTRLSSILLTPTPPTPSGLLLSRRMESGLCRVIMESTWPDAMAAHVPLQRTLPSCIRLIQQSLMLSGLSLLLHDHHPKSSLNYKYWEKNVLRDVKERRKITKSIFLLFWQG